jgi:glyoxylase-like metal-dependent hydrolase (beta-lactamase superfamily II)
MSLQIANKWFERRKVDPDITILWEPHVDPLIRCNIWHVRGRRCDLLIDTGLGISSLRNAARDLFEHSLQVVATHSHYDHIGGHHEFGECLAHRLEADFIRNADEQEFYGLRKEDISKPWADAIEGFGYPLPETLVTAIPEKGYDIRQYRLLGVTNVSTVDEGDRIDVGDRTFEVLHLPGHSPGSIGLWDEGDGILFSGDAVYDGPLLGDLPESNKADYVATLERLLDLPVTVVHAGHEASFGRERLNEIIREYLAAWRID